MKLPNIIVRGLAGIVFIAILLAGMLFSRYLFLVIYCILALLAVSELFVLLKRTKPEIKVSVITNCIGCLFLFVGTFFYKTIEPSMWVFVPYILFILFLFIQELYLKKEDPISSLGYSLFGQIYVAIPFTLLNIIAFFNGSTTFHYEFILALFVFIWVNDTFAYLTGMSIGKHRLFERISPKKSWEGFFGGIVFAIAASIAYSHFFPSLNIYQWIGFALITVVFGTFGDLFESLIKRYLGVKDSGKMIPGHGGILDRLDSTIIAIPAIVIYLSLL